MAAAQVAKKLKDKRQLKALEEIFKTVNITYVWLLKTFPQIVYTNPEGGQRWRWQNISY
jgi:hypothetical protein